MKAKTALQDIALTAAECALSRVIEHLRKAGEPLLAQRAGFLKQQVDLAKAGSVVVEGDGETA